MTRLPILLLLVLIPLAMHAQELIHYEVGARLVVYDADESSEALIRRIEDAGGYFLVWRTDYLEARLPAGEINRISTVLEKFSEEILDFTLNARDLTRELAQVRASLLSREEVLARNMDFLADADFTSTLAIEREVMQLIEEIELLKGSIARLENQSRFAALRLQLSSQGVAPSAGEASSFDWINSFDFYEFMADTPRERTLPWFPRFGDPRTGPAGFSVYERSVLYRAISPEGVRLRRRIVKPEPAMNSSFWQTALQRHLKSAGYQQRGALKPLEGDGRAGFSGMWLLPYAGEEYVYSAVVLLRKNRVEIIESAGPLESYDYRRTALEEWITGLE